MRTYVDSLIEAEITKYKKEAAYFHNKVLEYEGLLSQSLRVEVELQAEIKELKKQKASLKGQITKLKKQVTSYSDIISTNVLGYK